MKWRWPKAPAELKAQLATLREQQHTPCVSYAVFDESGVRLVDVDGIKDQSDKTVVNENTLFQIGSVTKMVTAIAVMQLIEQGHFILDTPVKTLLPTAPVSNRCRFVTAILA